MKLEEKLKLLRGYNQDHVRFIIGQLHIHTDLDYSDMSDLEIVACYLELQEDE